MNWLRNVKFPSQKLQISWYRERSHHRRSSCGSIRFISFDFHPRRRPYANVNFCGLLNHHKSDVKPNTIHRHGHASSQISWTLNSSFPHVRWPSEHYLVEFGLRRSRQAFYHFVVITNLADNASPSQCLFDWHSVTINDWKLSHATFISRIEFFHEPKHDINRKNIAGMSHSPLSTSPSRMERKLEKHSNRKALNYNPIMMCSRDEPIDSNHHYRTQKQTRERNFVSILRSIKRRRRWWCHVRDSSVVCFLMSSSSVELKTRKFLLQYF